MKHFLLIISIISFLSGNSQINNIAEKLGYDKDAKLLIIHGDEDTSVSVNEALALHSWSSKSQLVIIKGANHVFGSSHPWKLNNIPPHFHQINNEIIDFINN